MSTVSDAVAVARGYRIASMDADRTPSVLLMAAGGGGAEGSSLSIR